MTKQPWGPWKDFVPSESLPIGARVAFDDGTWHDYEGEPFSTGHRTPTQYCERLPEVVRTVDAYIVDNGSLTVFNNAGRYDTRRFQCVRLTITGELGKNPIKAEWV